jgi:site-specific DNA-adenine methylase
MNEFIGQVENFIFDSFNNFVKFNKEGKFTVKFTEKEKVGATAFMAFLMDQLQEAQKMIKEDK